MRVKFKGNPNWQTVERKPLTFPSPEQIEKLYKDLGLPSPEHTERLFDLERPSAAQIERVFKAWEKGGAAGIVQALKEQNTTKKTNA